jgi:hypothetical protein
MASVWGFLLGAIGAALAWVLTEFLGRPFRQFFDLRREVSSSLVQFANVRARSQGDGDNRTLIELAPPEEERLMEAQETFRRLGGEMRAFANAEFFANRVVTWFGFDAYEISKAPIGYSNEISTCGAGRKLYHDQVEKLLRIRSD